MAKDLLLELGMEEIPSRFVRGAMEQLADKVGKWLTESHIPYEALQSYGTPRRIAVLVRGLAEKQEDRHEEAKGPSRKIALDDKGEWSKAALGFARSQGVDPAELYFKELGGVEYVHAAKSSIGGETAALLESGLAPIITSMTFPKNMRWGSQELRFVRPIRWMAALFGEQVVPFEIAGVPSGRVTHGHRFLGGEVELSSAGDYVSALKEQFVYADVEERQALILDQINRLASEKGWSIPIKDDLLEEVLFLVEYPTALFGSFNPDFLHIPKEVLITSMREHQRYFPVLDSEGRLLPHFVTVRNGNAESLELVARGNEKVLRARLSDARFFYEEDQKMSIDSALSRLESIVFHEELGTIGDKVRRIRDISLSLAEWLKVTDLDKANVERTAAIAKFDLVSQMVYEFPELQGVMGEDYARKAGEREEVARAVFEHYQPRFSGDAVPSGLAGAVVSIADKIDTIVGCFSIGIIPTGSQDPYALRRQAAGIVQILLEKKFSCSLSKLFEITLDVHQKAGLLKRSEQEIRNNLYDFFALRVKNVLSERQVRYDIAEAVMASSIDDIASVVRRADALTAQTANAGFKTAVESFSRVNNLAAKAESADVDPALFTDPAEGALFKAYQRAHADYVRVFTEGNEDRALEVLATLEQPITGFFDAVMVMAEDERVKANRLGLLALISADFRQFADFSKLVW
ncbi:glycine--tRNA ligase subunit beta [Paenibacillus sp. CC-CFT747]|nr:glycine--tRNA ligase subunit beta [Paenibacillus sp. CC-CFT747]